MNKITIALTVVQAVFIARFHLEFSKIDGFIEPVNTIRKITNPLVMPLKCVIPYSSAKKWSAIILAWLITFVAVFAVNQSGINRSIFIASLFFISTWLSFLKYGMFLFIIGSWIQIPAMQRMNYLLHNIFAPMLKPIQQIIPGFGGLDFSPIIFLFLLSFAASLLSIV